MISIDDFKKVEVKIGRILSAEKVADTDKLLKLSVDFGLKLAISDTAGSPDHSATPTAESGLGEERDIRQIISGIAQHFPNLEFLVGKSCPFVVNLEHRLIKGLKSEGMIMAVGNPDGFFSLLEANKDTPPGSSVL